MNKKLTVCLVFLLLLGVLLIASCGNKDSGSYTDIGSNFFTIDGEMLTVSVPNKTSSIDIKDCIYISENASFEVSESSDFSNISDGKMSLEYGQNVFYIRVTDKNSNSKIYTVSVYRKNIFRVDFNTAGGTECKPQEVEEGMTAQMPESSKIGYSLAWDFDFGTPIFSDVTVNAIWTANDYTVKIDATGAKQDGKTFDIKYGEKYTLPTVEKSGYRFIKWQAFGTDFDSSGTWNLPSDAIVTAVFAKINYGINYVLGIDGAVNSSDNPLSFTVEDNVLLNKPSATFERAIFDGWYFEDGTRAESIPKGTTCDVTLYARWKTKYIVTFDAEGFDNIHGRTMDVYLGEEYCLPIIEKEDYNFTGWTFDGKYVSVKGAWSIENDVVLKAIIEPIVHDISYNLDGGVNSPENPTSFTMENNKIIFKNPTKDGFIFDGWYTSPEYSERVTEIHTDSKKSVILYAKWLAKYTVSLDADGGELNAGAIEMIFSKHYSLPKPTKRGYTFAGWYYGNNKIANEGTWNNECVQREIILKAVWSIDTYTITYVTDGGEGFGNVITFTVNSEDIVLPSPVRNGYKFGGFYLSESYDGEAVRIIKSGSVGSVTLYAKWVALRNVKVIFDAAGGAVSKEEQTIVEKSEYVLPLPKRTGYTFDGWYYNNLKIGQCGTWEVADDVTLKAHWIPIVYKITYVLDGGATDNSETYTVETPTFSLTAPKKDGYAFMGWRGTGISGVSYEVSVPSGIGGDREYTAVWFRKNAENGLVFDYKNGNAVVTGFNGSYKNTLVIPSEYEGVKVVSIEENAFYDCGKNVSGSFMFNVIIPESINHIGKNAFAKCDRFALDLVSKSGESAGDKKVRLENWIAGLFIESGNDYVLDAIRGIIPAIGYSKYV